VKSTFKQVSSCYQQSFKKYLEDASKKYYLVARRQRQYHENGLLESRSNVLEERPGSVEHVGELSRWRRSGGSCGQLILNQLSYPRRHVILCCRPVVGRHSIVGVSL